MGDPMVRQFAGEPEMDPFREEGALLEAQLLDIRFDALRSTLGLLFELRLALQLRKGNTGVLIAHDVRKCSWSAQASATGRTAWTVVGSLARVENQLLRLTLSILPIAGLELVASRAAFYVGDVPALGATPPDYVQDDERLVQAGLANWRSSFVPVNSTSIGPESTT